MHEQASQRIASLLAEVEGLGRTIDRLRADISVLRAADITADEIPSATDELDAVVAHTAAAAHAILESCEMLDALLPMLAGIEAQALQAATTRIYEACCFQDTTGQRITKVVATLKAIEKKVSAILLAFGPAKADGPAQQAGSPLGPPPSGAALAQSDVDRLFASAE